MRCLLRILLLWVLVMPVADTHAFFWSGLLGRAGAPGTGDPDSDQALADMNSDKNAGELADYGTSGGEESSGTESGSESGTDGGDPGDGGEA